MAQQDQAMVRVPVAGLTGAALDWAVAKCEGFGISLADDWYAKGEHVIRASFHGGVSLHLMTGGRWSPSQDWAQGGPIIEREGVNTFRYNKLVKSAPDVWCGHKVVPRPNMEGSTDMVALNFDAPTPLIAAMRCCVASKLGDTVEVPTELLEQQKK